jgi:hypothetical protein
MPFQFIHVQQGKGASASDRQAAFDMFCLLAYQVNQYKDYDGCCRMIVRATTSSGGTYYGCSGPGRHSEEHVFQQAYADRRAKVNQGNMMVHVKEAYIDIAPCHSDIYGKSHCCLEFFLGAPVPGGGTANGRMVKMGDGHHINCLFYPSENPTPVYYLLALPTGGGSTGVSTAHCTSVVQDQIDAMRSYMGLI